MKIEHVAIWTERLEELKGFYENILTPYPTINTTIRRSTFRLTFFRLKVVLDWS